MRLLGGTPFWPGFWGSPSFSFFEGMVFLLDFLEASQGYVYILAGTVPGAGAVVSFHQTCPNKGNTSYQSGCLAWTTKMTKQRVDGKQVLGFLPITFTLLEKASSQAAWFTIFWWPVIRQTGAFDTWAQQMDLSCSLDEFLWNSKIKKPPPNSFDSIRMGSSPYLYAFLSVRKLRKTYTNRAFKTPTNQSLCFRKDVIRAARGFQRKRVKSSEPLNKRSPPLSLREPKRGKKNRCFFL